VRVTPEDVASQQGLDVLVAEVQDLMCALDGSCGCTVGIEPKARLLEGFFGDGYGEPLGAASAAMELGRQAGLILDTTYTGRAFAALMADAATGASAGERVVFWDTFDSHDFSAAIEGYDPSSLPAAFAGYFTDDASVASRG